MNSIFLLFFGLLFFFFGWRIYAAKFEKIFGLDFKRPTPAIEKYDGVDYVPAKNWLVLFGHHFSSIAGAGPVIGPVIGCIYWGWLPALLWVVLGSVFIGGIHDFSALMISVREGGNSVADIAVGAISKKAKYIFAIFVWLALVLVVAVFVYLCAKTFVTEPKVVLPSLGLIPVAILTGYLIYVKKAGFVFPTILGLFLLTALIFLGEIFSIDLGENAFFIWMIILLIYCFAASIAPVNILLQPRDYLCSYLLVFGAGAGFIGLLISRPAVVQPPFIAWDTSQGSLWPMMFVTIACGAISGFHSLIASGTTSKQLPNERYARRIGYGAMLAEGVVALIAILAVVAGIKGSGSEVCDLLSESGPICVFGHGYAGLTKRLLGGYGLFIAMMILNAFILTTLDTATRVCRYITEELTGIKNRFISTFIIVVLAAVLALSGAWNRIWPVFGASNQLVAALTLFVVSCWLLARNKPIRFTIIPAIFMFVMTFFALAQQAVSYFKDSNYLLLMIAVVLMVLSLLMVNEARKVLFFKKKGKLSCG